MGQWHDVTDQLRAEEEVERIVQAAAAGDLSDRIVLEGKSGFIKQVSAGINQLMSTTSQGLEEIARVLSAISNGDLTQRITQDFHGVYGRLKNDANRTSEQLRTIVLQMKHSSESINVAAREIAAGNADLSTRTEQQTANLEESAASIEQLTSTVKQNADNAKQANVLAIGASQVAVKGGVVVDQVVRTMSAITESSKKIQDIISVIDAIAFQTNILALNAAVEAARAGEQGRGFAVVAMEVRNLAQRSAGAAKEIKGLIDASVERVNAGSQQVDEAGGTMRDIVTSVRRVTDIIGEISAASEEQSRGIEQVNGTITTIDEMTQQNAALVEEAAGAAQTLQSLASSLTESFAQFVIDVGGVEEKTRRTRAAS